ncbi:MAG: tRNA (N(6)-L-threonylcarbamoyladenosine(37)-C(2))-methylthiotransferase MtaB [Candidatus Goldbacteria bacterium]|nr:tRNA (N(6)-L-threonylcarbamoyladenosine(37)-C(2))-methylthiotransferase MtaB [Candidatus Goldiibacteriota bacterium]
MKIALHTYGCKVNSYETEIIRQQIKSVSLCGEDADIHIINTCTVTEKIDKEILRKIKQLKKNGKKVILTGCLVERKDEDARNILSFADGIITNKEKFELGKFFNQKNYDDNQLLYDFTGRDRAFIKIEDGCNNYCSYCEVPYVRGDKIKSKKIEDIKKEFTILSETGFNEIVLTGVNLGLFGRDKNKNNALYELLLELIKIKNNTRIRLSSIGPKELSDEVISLIADSYGKICPHVHLSLQSGDDKILKLMNRNYTLNEYIEKMEKLILKIPYCAITTDVIAGFPGEGEKEFQNTYDFIKKMNFSRLHVFSFSKRPDTKASKMPEQVKEEIKKLRVKKLINLGKIKEKEFAYKNLGLVRKVLVESEEKDGYKVGYTDNYIRVRFKVHVNLTGQLVDVRLQEYKDGFVYGEMV